jgi:predicted Zn-dependent protease
MTRLLSQLAILLLVFFGMWYLLSQVNWMKKFHIERASLSLEEKLGDLFWESIKQSNVVMLDPAVTKPVDSLLQKICEANHLDADKLKLHIVESSEVNAFAMPNGHMVVYSGLIEQCDNEAELVGVMAHELAHIQHQHVMKKLLKEVGIATLVSLTTGNRDGGAVHRLASSLSSAAYDRTLEKDADLTGVEYLITADIDPEQLANFLYKQANKDSKMPVDLSWLSTHPDSKDRAAYILDAIKDKKLKKITVLHPSVWKKLQSLSREAD